MHDHSLLIGCGVAVQFNYTDYEGLRGVDQVKMPIKPVFFVYPGDLNTPTGGYHYDRRVIHELVQSGVQVQPIALSASFPNPNSQALAEAADCFAQLPDGALVLVDGLVFGVIDELVRAEADRLCWVALCHHPLALESGLTPAQQARLKNSEQQALALARAVIVTSQHTANLVMTEFGVPPELITVALPGTDRQGFARGQGEPPILLTLASLTPRKGHDVLVQALAEITDLSWQARWVGSPDLDSAWQAKLVALVARLGLSDRITLVGTVAEPTAEFQQADVFVLPSRFEGYGMVFAEALAAGLPIVAARAGAVPDVVPADAGILVPPDNVPALAAALRLLLTNPQQRKSMQLAAQAAAAELPTWAETARRILAALKEQVDL
jgi:glycosyltransferase involved in cell wall biosynthesis